MTKNIATLKSNNGLSWINIVQAQKKEIEYLRRKFKFNEIDLQDSFTNQYAQRPKFYQRNNYCFLIMQFPIFNQKTRTMEPEEIDFFIGPDYLISIHKNNLPPLVELFNLCGSDYFYSQQYLAGNNVALLYEIVVRLQEYCYSLLDQISLNIKSIEQNIFAGHERRMVTEILFVKRNILNFRKIIEAHKNIISKIINEKMPFFRADKAKIYYHNLIEHAKNIWETLDSQKVTIEALEDTNTSLLTFKLNDIMRVLTIFSVAVFPLTLLASVFGMNVVNSMPFVNNPFGFWIIMSIMAGASLLMFLFFRHRHWL